MKMRLEVDIYPTGFRYASDVGNEVLVLWKNPFPAFLFFKVILSLFQKQWISMQL